MMKRAIALLVLAVLVASPSYSQEDAGQVSTDAEGGVVPNDTVGLAQVSEVPAVCAEIVSAGTCNQTPSGGAPVQGAQDGAAPANADPSAGKSWWDWITGN
jgi:hypothetical protein